MVTRTYTFAAEDVRRLLRDGYPCDALCFVSMPGSRPYLCPAGIAVATAHPIEDCVGRREALVTIPLDEDARLIINGRHLEALIVHLEPGIDLASVAFRCRGVSARDVLRCELEGCR